MTNNTTAITTTTLREILTKNLPDDLYNIVQSYLKEGEQLYYTNKWDLINRYHKKILLIEDHNFWSVYLKRYDSKIFITHCIKTGSLNALKWFKNEFPWKFLDHSWSRWACGNAALCGHLELLKWLRDNGGCPWGIMTCENAAEGGHLELLKWVRNEGCPWDKRVCSYAAKGGYLELLKWAKDNGCPG